MRARLWWRPAHSSCLLVHLLVWCFAALERPEACCAPGSLSQLVESEAAEQERPNASLLLRRLERRQALKLAIERLRVLESLDEQLRSFSEAAAAAVRTTKEPEHLLGSLVVTRQRGARRKRPPERAGVRLCELLVDVRGNGEARPRNCLLAGPLRRQVPPYMLNLFRQLLVELSANNQSASSNEQQQQQQEEGSNTGALASTAERLMPYSAQTMRSIRQAPIEFEAVQEGGQADQGEEEQEEEREDQELREGAFQPTNLMVELSLVEQLHAGSQAARAATWTTAAAAARPELQRRRRRRRSSSQATACEPAQRLMAAHERTELCFWFELEHAAQALAQAASNSTQRTTNGQPYERLVEAELHLFKLLPEVQQLRGGPVAPSERRAGAASHTPSDSAPSARRKGQMGQHLEQPSGRQPAAAAAAAAAFHLKTNLLEVSLYQVLARPAAATVPSDNSSRNERNEHKRDLPLRLLDIRRIDLHSSGWETFYVKRAVDDWLRDADNNLGLVIRAKSMFDEPLQAGLLRFADSMDHRRRAHDSAAAARRAADFDLSHQPLLVMYTRASWRA